MLYVIVKVTFFFVGADALVAFASLSPLAIVAFPSVYFIEYVKSLHTASATDFVAEVQVKLWPPVTVSIIALISPAFSISNVYVIESPGAFNVPISPAIVVSPVFARVPAVAYPCALPALTVPKWTSHFDEATFAVPSIFNCWVKAA